jgi:glycosyltransferase involved in cell wall biosynthesis
LFLGSISRSFDFETLIKCAKEIKNINIKFIICGEGELKEYLMKNSKGLENIIFTGWIDINKINSIANRSSIAIAPYKNLKNFKDNIPNKILDYISLGLPVLSPLNGEVSSLIKNKKIGLHYKDGSSISLKKKIFEFLNDQKKLNLYSSNVKKIYKSDYNYNLVYKNAVKLIEKIYLKNSV